MARGDVAVRLAQLLRYCQGRHRVSLADAALELGLSPRTVRRYLEAMEFAGLSVPRWRAVVE